MSSKIRSSGVPILPPLASPSRRSVTNPRANEDSTALNVLHSHQHGPTDLETRVDLLEQAHKLLLEEMVNAVASGGTGGGHNDMGVAKSGVSHTQSTLSLVLKQLTETERQVYSLQSQLDQLVGVVQRTRDESHSYQRSSIDFVNKSIEDVKRKVLSVEDGFQSNTDKQKKAWSETLSTMSSNLSNQIRGGAKAVTDLQRGLKEVESTVHNLSDDLSRANIAAMNLQTAQLDTARLTQSRHDELVGVLKVIQERVSNIEAHDHQQNIWLKESFNDIEDRLTKMSTSSLSVIKSVASHVHQLDSKLQLMEVSMKERLESLNGQWKKEKKGLEDRVREDLSKIKGAEFSKGTTTLVELSKDVENFKAIFKEQKVLVTRNLSALSKSLSLLERENQAVKQDLTQVLEAEIRTRREEGLTLRDHCSSVIDSYGETAKCVKLALVELEKKASQNHTELSESIKEVRSQWKEAQYRLLSDVDTRLLTAVHDKKQERDVVLEEVKSISQELNHFNERLSKVESSKKTHVKEEEELSAKIHKINVTLSETSSQLHEFIRDVQDMHSKLGSQVQNESSKRFQEMIQLRNELSWLNSQLMSSHYQPHQSYHHHQYPPPAAAAGINNGSNNASLTAPSVFITQNESMDGRGNNRQVGMVTSPTPEPLSPQSSPSVAHKWKKSRKGHGGSTVRHAIQEVEPTETMGTFTSLAPTPVELRKILGNEASDYLLTTTEQEEPNEIIQRESPTPLLHSHHPQHENGGHIEGSGGREQPYKEVEGGHMINEDTTIFGNDRDCVGDNIGDSGNNSNISDSGDNGNIGDGGDVGDGGGIGNVGVEGYSGDIGDHDNVDKGGDIVLAGNSNDEEGALIDEDSNHSIKQ